MHLFLYLGNFFNVRLKQRQADAYIGVCINQLFVDIHDLSHRSLDKLLEKGLHGPLRVCEEPSGVSAPLLELLLYTNLSLQYGIIS